MTVFHNAGSAVKRLCILFTGSYASQLQAGVAFLPNAELAASPTRVLPCDSDVNK